MFDTLYFGTYTKRDSKGIYTAKLDLSTGQLSALKLLTPETSPTYLTFNPKGQLYSVAGQNGQGGIGAYTLTGDLLNHVLEDGASLCYVAYDGPRQLVYGSNYHKGQVTAYRIEEDGSLTLVDSVNQEGSGPHPNQGSSHVHFSDLTPDKYLVTCDLGADRVTTYAVADSGKLTPITHYQAQSGSGPRHLVFHPHFKMAYLACELNSTVETLVYDGVGDFDYLSQQTTLPVDYQGDNAVGAIRMSQDGKFVYVSNRGHNSITVFKVLADGNLQQVQIVPSQGDFPRDFNFSSDQNFLIVVHQESDNATVFKRDPQTGRLELLTSDFYVPEAVFVSTNPYE
ncbi:lactonase family protein [Streptococcus danieliae]|uniref:Lactonase family protein n=1 Tax=Streptococcus danieliae TaxID=747656 RepID=A0A7Z0S4S4_9STRE|nr:lactonase family protein [Streptococcus danieliae]MBF0699308.1 lactonase family protein [Streptococcus danieliae]NYS96484.1 lactonase family protein [Streptococcus danieliae]